MSPRPCSLAPGLPLSRRPANQLHRVGPLFLLLIIGFSLCSPVAAVDIYPQYLTDRVVTSTPYSVPAKTVSSRSLGDITSFQIYNIQNYPNLRTIYVKINIEYYDNYNPTEWQKYDSRRQSVDLLIGDELVGSGYLCYNGFYTDGYMTVLQVWLTIEEWDIGTRTGTTTVTIQQTGDLPYTDLKCKFFFGSVSASSTYPAVFSLKFVGNYIVNDIFEWENTIDCNDTGIALMRNGDYSTIEITTDSGVYTDSGFDDREYFLPAPYNWNLTNPKGKTFTGSYDGMTAPDPEDPNVIVYVKNSQTGALIADANIVIDALVNDEYYTVVNRTEPSGIFSITLQPTGGGQPNPDGYRLIATADGYNNPMPEINFTVDDYKLSINCLLDPIAGGPENENKTFIDFFVRDMSSNPISGATVKFGKYTLITNSQGYTVFEVDKNNNYAWIISKSGYGALTGNAVIGDAPRHTINTVLAPAVTPTPQTPIPTGTTIGPKPTMTAPTGETVSNWLEWFAAHFGMILGGGAEIGKIFMWLCFAVPVGVYVGKEAKAGAAGFMAGAGIVTLFFVLIGWVPIWLLVLLALIIGLLYTKVFNNPDNGGGR